MKIVLDVESSHSTREDGRDLAVELVKTRQQERDYEPTECTPDKPDKNAGYHVNGDVVGETFSCPDCGLTCEV